jgi:hypothetical protein
VAELADALDLGSSPARGAGSSPVSRIVFPVGPKYRNEGEVLWQLGLAVAGNRNSRSAKMGLAKCGGCLSHEIEGKARTDSAGLILYVPRSAALRSRSIVGPQQSAESLSALEVPAGQPDFFSRVDDVVIQPLMISFAVKMQQELANSFSQRPFASFRIVRTALLKLASRSGLRLLFDRTR